VSALDGFHACIFAYGQTGSGKTFTMEGPPASAQAQPQGPVAAAEQRGVYHRSLAELFAQAAARAKEWEFTFSAQMVEIYNDDVVDLLAERAGAGTGAGAGAGAGAPAAATLEIKQGANGMLHMPEATVVRVAQQAQVEVRGAAGAGARAGAGEGGG
jgi:hypothetical protein